MEKNDLTKPACIIITRIQTLPSVSNYWLKLSPEFLKGLFPKTNKWFIILARKKYDLTLFQTC